MRGDSSTGCSKTDRRRLPSDDRRCMKQVKTAIAREQRAAAKR
jgi:hypothetical protein